MSLQNGDSFYLGTLFCTSIVVVLVVLMERAVISIWMVRVSEMVRVVCQLPVGWFLPVGWAVLVC